MLNNLFKPPVSRAEHNALKGERAALLDLLATVKLERDKAIAERNDAQQEHAAAVNRELKATELLHRACVLLNEVDPSRSGGKQLRVAREALFADAMLAGLWGELPGKEE